MSGEQCHHGRDVRIDCVECNSLAREEEMEAELVRLREKSKRHRITIRDERDAAREALREACEHLVHYGELADLWVQNLRKRGGIDE